MLAKVGTLGKTEFNMWRQILEVRDGAFEPDLRG